MMTIRKFMTMAGVVGVLLPAGVSGAAPPRPNFVFMLTDDQGWGDVAYNGHPVMQTPELDKMAATGMRFDRFYAAASVCSPTRVSCLTGRNNWRVNITGPIDSHQGHLPQEEITLAEALKPGGYVSGHFGKWHVGGFDKKRSGIHYMPPWHAGFDECFSSHNVMVTFDPYARMHKHGIEALYWYNGRNIPFEEGQKDPSLQGCDAAIVMAKALEFIGKQAAAKRPFLALVWFHNVHTPLGKNPELMGLYPDCESQEQVYFSNITAIDRQVGRLRRELRALGIADNTMVWFASDNGPNLKGKKTIKFGKAQGGKFNYTPIGSSGAFRGWKRDCYEGGLRVPGILEWPARIKKPAAADFPVVTSDWFPTVLEAAGVPLPTDRKYDGISLIPFIEGRMSERTVPIGFHCNGMEAWTESRYKIVRALKSKRGSTEWQLYDLLVDPFEEQNTAASKPEVLQRMTREFAAWAESVEKDRQAVATKYYK